MCNAYNHPLGCNCGWGGVNYGTSEYGYFTNLLSSQPSISSKYDNEAKTFLTSCPWSGANVYYHSNGYGDSVYFDSLGYPWQIHECFKNYCKSKKSTRYLHSTQSSLSEWQDFFEVDSNEQKRLILIGAACQIQSTLGSLSYTKEALAEQMGISIESLRAIYGHLYFRELNGIRFFTDEQKRLRKCL